MDLNTFFDFFSVVFIPALILMLVGGVGVTAWVASSFIYKIKEGFELNAQLSRPAIVAPASDLARAHMKTLREAADRARLERIKRKHAVRRAEEKASALDLPVELNHIKFLEREGEAEDVTAELFEEAKCVIARKLSGQTEYFMAVLKGSGPRLQAKFCWSPFRSLSQKMSRSQATALLPLLPGGTRELFILAVEEKENATQNSDCIAGAVGDASVPAV